MNKGANGRGLPLYFFLPASSPRGKWCKTDAQSDTPSAILIETPHISALKGAFAKTVLMPGDPLRARNVLPCLRGLPLIRSTFILCVYYSTTDANLVFFSVFYAMSSPQKNIIKILFNISMCDWERNATFKTYSFGEDLMFEVFVLMFGARAIFSVRTTDIFP